MKNSIAIILFFLIYLFGCKNLNYKLVNIKLLITTDSSLVKDSTDYLPQTIQKLLDPIIVNDTAFVPDLYIKRIDLNENSPYHVVVPLDMATQIRKYFGIYNYTALIKNYSSNIPTLNSGQYLATTSHANSSTLSNENKPNYFILDSISKINSIRDEIGKYLQSSKQFNDTIYLQWNQKIKVIISDSINENAPSLSRDSAWKFRRDTMPKVVSTSFCSKIKVTCNLTEIKIRNLPIGFYNLEIAENKIDQYYNRISSNGSDIILPFYKRYTSQPEVKLIEIINLVNHKTYLCTCQ